MAVSIRQIHPVFVGEVSGVDLRRPLSRDEVAVIEAGMDRHAVLIFPGQHITDEQQIAFTRNFGEIENSAGGNVTKPDQKRLDPLMNDVSNLGEDNRPLARDDRRRLFNLGNQLWHSDSSFRAVPAKYSLLSGRTVAKKGGNTEFADMRAAYDALPEATRRRLATLTALHGRSNGPAGEKLYGDDKGKTEKEYAELPRPAVTHHPVTGRPILFVNPMHCHGIVGMSREESWPLIEELAAHATQERFVYYHSWQVGDLLMWDERATMHRGAGDYHPEERRIMLRTIVYPN